MKKLIAILLTLVMVFALCACGGTTAPEPTPEPTPEATPEPTLEPTPEPGLSVDDILGVWELDREKAGDQSYGFWQIMQIFKGGTGKGFADGFGTTAEEQMEKGSFLPMTWEIKDDCLIVSLTMDPLSVAYELVDGNLVSTDGTFVFVKMDEGME